MANYITITGSNVKNAAGQPLADGLIEFQATNAFDVPLSFQLPGVGQVTTKPAVAAVTSGSIGSLQVANPNVSVPAVYYRITVRDLKAGTVVLTYRKVLLPNVASWSFDGYQPTTPAQVLPNNGGTISGPVTLQSALTLAADPSAALQAATKQYVDNGLASKVSSVAGRGGNVTLAASDISGLAMSATTDTTNANNITTGTLALSRLPSGITASNVNGYAPGNSSGNIAINNGTTNSNLNADMVDGNHASAFQLVSAKGAASGYAPLDSSSKVPVVNLPTLSSLSGTLLMSQVPTGGTSSTFMRGDGTWATPPGGVSLGIANTWTTLQTFSAGVSGTTGDFTGEVHAGGGSGNAFKIGDDCRLVDINSSNTAAVQGVQDATQGWLKFGSAGPTIGSLSGSTTLTCNGTLSASAYQVNGSAFSFANLAGTASTSQLPARTAALIYVIDGGGAVPSTGVKGQVTIPTACTITGWYLTADASGSATINVNTGSYAGFPTVTTKFSPSLASAQKNSATGLSYALSAGDQVQFSLSAVTTSTRLNLTLVVSIPYA